MRESERNECGATNKENGVSSSRQTGEQRTAIRACSSFIRSMLGPMNFSFTILNIGFLGCWWFDSAWRTDDPKIMRRCCSLDTGVKR